MADSACVWTLILKLRRNILLEGDLSLAELEIRALLTGRLEPLYRGDFDALVSKGLVAHTDTRYCRESGVVAYRIQTARFDPVVLFRRLSFIELVSGRLGSVGAEIPEAFETVPSRFARIFQTKNGFQFRLIPLNAVIEWSDVTVKKAKSGDHAIRILETVLAVVLDGSLPDAISERTLSAKITTGHLYHGLHVYKAKFFPRFVRTLLNVYAANNDSKVLDPFMGSGTALVEAASMGMQSAGVDIDPLSVLIAGSKSRLLNGGNQDVPEAVALTRDRIEVARTGQLPLFIKSHTSSLNCRIPSFLTRRIPEEIQREVIADIEQALSAMEDIIPEVAEPLRVALSDAISRKFKFRFLGLGYGRFSLNIMPGRILEMFAGNLEYLAKSIVVWQWLCEVGGIKPRPFAAELGDARSLTFGESAFDLIITSPPYMPASSGRENYLKSKALAMTALGLIDADAIDACEQMQVGSVHRTFEEMDTLPPQAQEVVTWMAGDEVRQIKAAASASYFADLAQSLREIRRVLRPGGRCAMVIARQHTFYRYKSREIVRTIDNAGLVSELADSCGLETEDILHVELNKQNAVARPRSLDAYYETVLVLGRK